MSSALWLGLEPPNSSTFGDEAYSQGEMPKGAILWRDEGRGASNPRKPHPRVQDGAVSLGLDAVQLASSDPGLP